MHTCVLSTSRALSIECWVVFNLRLNYNTFMKKILRASLIIILSAIIVQIIFGSEASFLPGDFIATITGIFSSIGGAGLVGFLLGGLCLYIVLKKQKNK